jgi:hypothetical protein
MSAPAHCTPLSAVCCRVCLGAAAVRAVAEGRLASTPSTVWAGGVPGCGQLLIVGVSLSLQGKALKGILKFAS